MCNAVSDLLVIVVARLPGLFHVYARSNIA